MIYVQRQLCDTFDVTTTKRYVQLSEFTIQGDKPIKTTGSSTTVAAVTAGDAPFKYLGVNDVIIVQVDATFTTRTITVKTDNDTVTVDSTVDFSNGGAGRHFRWRQASVGTTDTSGLINVSGWRDKTLHVTVETYNAATNITASVEGVVAGSNIPAELEDPQGNPATISFTGVGSGILPIYTNVDSLRVGFIVNGADSGTNYVTAWVGGQISPSRG